MMRQANHFIAGEWTAGESGAVGSSINPSTGQPVGDYAQGSAADVDAAVAAARRAFERGGWSNNPRRRAEALYGMADALAARRAEIVPLAVAESGKLTREIEHEINAGISELRYYAGLARAVFGRVQEIGEGALSIFAREPAGVAGIIVPWNAPITLLVRSLAPALAAGCTAVIKPAPQTSLTNGMLMDVFAGVEALPPGVVNAVNERQAEVGRALVAHRDVDVISFTGSCATGKKIMESAAGTLKRLSLELGGKSPSVVFADADADAAVSTIVGCATVMAGQMCTAISRVLVEDAAYDAIRDKLAARFGALRVGAADDPQAQMGPVVDRANRERLKAVIDGADGGCEFIVKGGVPGHLPRDGAFLTPSLVAVDDLSSRFVQEELFGPILTIERFSDEAEAMHKTNATVYGLAASVWTNDVRRAQRTARALKFGTVWLNSHNRLFAEAETGGFKQSGFGRLHGLEGLNDFLETKHIYSEFGWVPAQEV